MYTHPIASHSRHPSAYPHHVSDRPDTEWSRSSMATWIEQVQLTLAIANPTLLRHILLTCFPSLIAPHRLGSVSIKVAAPLDSTHMADGVVSFESIACVLADNAACNACSPAASTTHRRAIVNQVCCETKLQPLGVNLVLTEAIALLQYATFPRSDIQRIIHLPYDGWHRSWWAMLDPDNQFSIPFQRLMRARRYADGTLTLQYKDQFAHLPPPCFRTQQDSILIHIQRPDTSFASTLAWINHARQHLGTTHSLLIYHHLSELERQAFVHQGIYLYHGEFSINNFDAHELDVNQFDRHEPNIAPPSPPTDQVSCVRCTQQQCPMHGKDDSPVVTCRSFQARDAVLELRPKNL